MRVGTQLLTKHDNVNATNNRVWNGDKYSTELVYYSKNQHDDGPSLYDPSAANLKDTGHRCQHHLG